MHGLGGLAQRVFVQLTDAEEVHDRVLVAGRALRGLAVERHQLLVPMRLRQQSREHLEGSAAGRPTHRALSRARRERRATMGDGLAFQRESLIEEAGDAKLQARPLLGIGRGVGHLLQQMRQILPALEPRPEGDQARRRPRVVLHQLARLAEVRRGQLRRVQPLLLELGELEQAGGARLGIVDLHQPCDQGRGGLLVAAGPNQQPGARLVQSRLGARLGDGLVERLERLALCSQRLGFELRHAVEPRGALLRVRAARDLGSQHARRVTRSPELLVQAAQSVERFRGVGVQGQGRLVQIDRASRILQLVLAQPGTHHQQGRSQPVVLRDRADLVADQALFVLEALGVMSSPRQRA